MKKQENMPEGFTSLLNDEEINEIDKEIEDLQKKKQEKEEIAKFHKKVRDNELLAKNNIDLYNSEQQKVVRKSFYRLLKYSIICLLIIIIGGIVVLFFMGYQGYFKSSNTCDPTNICSEIPECPAQIPCPECPDLNCPQQNCSLSCGNITINPIVYTNSS